MAPLRWVPCAARSDPSCTTAVLVLPLQAQGALQRARSIRSPSRFVTQCSPHSSTTLQEIARDYHANWMTAVEMLNDDAYIGGEGECNVFTLRRNAGKNEEAIVYVRLQQPVQS